MQIVRLKVIKIVRYALSLCIRGYTLSADRVETIYRSPLCGLLFYTATGS
jgi:hypothetical protein